MDLMRIAALEPTDASAYRALMLEAYTTAADAFTSTPEERAAAPLSWWQRRIAAADGLSRSLGAFDGSQLVGTVTLELSDKPKTRHSGLVIGMYVRPDVRGHGLGRRLMQALLDEAAARPGIEVLRLTVTEGNEPALRLYASLGFVTWGVEPHALRTSGGLRGRVHMARRMAWPADRRTAAGDGGG